MADSKITALTALTAADPANDMIPIVDVSDTPPASGNTKRISINNILACSPSATLASATISGDLTVDTSTLYVSSSADKVGIGTTSLSNEKLTVAGNISANAWLGRSNISAPAGDCSIFRSADNTLGFGIASTTAMTLNATGLGVGTTPSYKLHVFGASPSLTIQDSSSAAGGVGGTMNFISYTSGTSGANIEAQIKGVKSSASSAGELLFFTSDSSGISQQRFMVDGTGNVGIGVTPSYKLDTYTTLQGTVTTKQFANRTSNKILVKRFFGITADTALFSVECGTAGAGAMAAFEINVFATGQKSGVSSDRQFYGKWYVTRNLAGTFTITSAFSSGSSGAFTVAASGTSLNVNGIFSVISDGSACVEVTGYIGGRDTVVETALNVTMP